MVWRRVGITDDKQNRATITPEGALNVALSGDGVSLEFPESIDVNVTNPTEVTFPSTVTVVGTVGTYAVAAADTANIFSYTLSDAQGAAAANNFLGFFMNSGSARSARVLEIGIGSYCLSGSTTAASMRVIPISGSEGGTQMAGSVLRHSGTATHFAELRTGNPTLAAFGVTAFASTPPTAEGTPTLETIYRASELDPGIVLPPGRGLGFQTTAGAAFQRWNISITWSEFAS